VVNLIATDMPPSDLGKVIAAISDSLTRRLIELAFEQFGRPPMPFQFLVFGSQARQDQSLGSDQDNGLMLSRTPTADEAAYFAQISAFICDGLAQCGIKLCPGDIMATNPKWRLTQEGWKKEFINWVQSSAPSALLQASIFFDIRCVYGAQEPVDAVIHAMQAEVAKNSLFHATLTKSALTSKPPIGFFRNFLLESSGEHKHQMDLKHQGLALINDLARIYGLACKRYKVSTKARLEQAAREKLLSSDVARNLMEAWDELNGLRLEAQRRHFQAHGEASAYVDPSELSPLERKHLKATFAIISEGQSAAQQRFARGYA
jgi:CBS domain-containing protein